MNIQLTEAARARMHEFLSRDAAAVAVRFGIRRTGCSGFGYTVEIAHELRADDRILDQDGIKLVVDPKALPLVDGTEIDYQRQGINAAFVFRNPNAAGECGCGESFTVDEPLTGTG